MRWQQESVNTDYQSACEHGYRVPTLCQLPSSHRPTQQNCRVLSRLAVWIESATICRHCWQTAAPADCWHQFVTAPDRHLLSSQVTTLLTETTRVSIDHRPLRNNTSSPPTWRYLPASSPLDVTMWRHRKRNAPSVSSEIQLRRSMITMTQTLLHFIAGFRKIYASHSFIFKWSTIRSVQLIYLFVTYLLQQCFTDVNLLIKFHKAYRICFHEYVCYVMNNKSYRPKSLIMLTRPKCR